MWEEERTEPEDQGGKGSDLRSVGISQADVESDLESAEGMENAPDEGEGMAPEVTAPVAPPGGAAAPAGTPPPV